MDIDVLAIAAVAITVVLFVLLSYLGRNRDHCTSGSDLKCC